MSDDTIKILSLHAEHIGSLLAHVKLLHTKVAALEAMLVPTKVIATDWGIPKPEKSPAATIKGVA